MAVIMPATLRCTCRHNTSLGCAAYKLQKKDCGERQQDIQVALKDQRDGEVKTAGKPKDKMRLLSILQWGNSQRKEKEKRETELCFCALFKVYRFVIFILTSKDDLLSSDLCVFRPD